MRPANIAIVGGSSAIAQALIEQSCKRYAQPIVHVFSRSLPSYKQRIETVCYHVIDYADRQQLAQAAAILQSAVSHDDTMDQQQCKARTKMTDPGLDSQIQPSMTSASHTDPHKQADRYRWDEVWVCLGSLQQGQWRPEKSLSECSVEHYQHSFLVNTIYPAMIAQYFAPLLAKNRISANGAPTKPHSPRAQGGCLAMLSARVGSISDNRLGGWYSYRAAKAALNMIIKNTAIEIKRSNPDALVVGLHPGTVATPLSQPWLARSAHKVFTPEQAAQYLIAVIDALDINASGRIWAWDGQEISP